MRIPTPATRHPKNRRRIVLLFITGAILVAAALLVTRFPSRPTADHITAPSDEKYYFSSSNYDGVRSKFVTRDNAREQTSIEYPLTSSQAINAFITQHIEEFDADFKESVAAGSSFNEPMTQTITYQITHHTENHLSIVLYIKQDTMGAHPLAATRFWTFDKTTGRPITTRELMNNADEAQDALVQAAQRAVTAQLAQRDLPTSNVSDDITAEPLEHFIVADETSIGFPMGAGAMLPSSYGEITVSIPVDVLAEHMRHPLAQSLFRVPPPAEPSQPSTPVPSTEQTAKPTPPPTAGADNVCARKACVALTFDDGPGPHTERLLDMLKTEKVRATFYVLGNKAGGNGATLKRMLSEGHQIGNHSWGHTNLTKVSSKNVRDELVTTNDAIRRVTGHAPNTMRPPYGATNATVQAEMKSAGLASVLWSVDTRDWADRNSAIVCQRAVGSAQNGSIILLHDIHKTSVDAVPCIIDGLKKQGFHLVTVNTLLGSPVPGQSYRSR